MNLAMKLRPLLFVACLLPAPAFGEGPQFKNGEVVTIQPDKAYLIARSFEMKGRGLAGTLRMTPALIRILSGEELRQADEARQSDPEHWEDKVEPNVVVMLAAEPYAMAGDEMTLMTAVKPGTYVLAGVAGAN